MSADLIKLSQDEQQANIVRATAIELLAQYPQPASMNARIAALASHNVLIREAAVRTLAQLPVEERVDKLSPLLNDPARAVRVEVATNLASVPSNLIPEKYQKALKTAINEYESLQEANLDMPSSYFNLGNLYHKLGDHNKAVKAYQLSIDLHKSFYPAQQNLATLLNALNRNDEAIKVLSDAVEHNTENGELHYSLGLLYAEKNNMEIATPILAKAAKLLPNHIRVQYNYALALQGQGEVKKAEAVLIKAYELNPNEPDILYALTILYAQQKNWTQALQFANALKVLFPESNRIITLINHIQSQM